MSVLAFARTGTPARKQVEARDRGVCARCGMDTEYVKALCRPYLAEACRWQASGNREFAAELRLVVISFLMDLGFSRTITVRAIATWGGVINTHLWEANHIVPVVHGGGGSCGMENLETLCRACHARETSRLAGVRAKDKRIQRKNARHAERMAAKQQRLIPLASTREGARHVHSGFRRRFLGPGVILGSNGGGSSTNADDPRAFVRLERLEYRADLRGVRRFINATQSEVI